MKNTSVLPKRKRFYSRLTEDSITSDQYAHAQKVWNSFQVRNLLEYCAIYCATDTLLLAEIFQKFRFEMYENFSGLDVSHFISLPGFAWESMLKITGESLGTLHDPKMFHFIDSGVRGGLSYVCTRFCEKKSDNEIVYIDANVR